MLSPWERKTLTFAAVIVTVVLVAVAFSSRADAATSWRRVGTSCTRVTHTLWSARLCVTTHARRDRLGQWQVRPAAAVAGYTNRVGPDRHRRMNLAVAARLGPVSDNVGARYTRLRVARGWPWQVAVGPIPPSYGRAVVGWPDGTRSVHRWRSDP